MTGVEANRELDAIAKRVGSNRATVRRWCDDLGLWGMTIPASAKAIKDAKAGGYRLPPRRSER